MTVTAGYILLKTAYQLTPIILTGGLAQFMGGGVPIIMLTEGVNFFTSLVAGISAGGGLNPQLDGFFANYEVLPGGQLINTTPATYPSATQVVAANAQVTQPKTVSLRMICPASGPQGGYLLKQAIMMGLQAALDQHNSLGGTYTVVTPSYIYTNCLLVRMTDISAGETSQVQYVWQMDFYQPLLTQSQIESALGGLLSAFTNGVQPAALAGLALNVGGIGVPNPGSFFSGIGTGAPGFGGFS